VLAPYSGTAADDRIGAAVGMRVEDVYPLNRRLWLRLHEKGGKQHAMPCHHNLEADLHEYLDVAGLANEPKAMLFQTYRPAHRRSPAPGANHASTRTMQLYDRPAEEVTLDEVERTRLSPRRPQGSGWRDCALLQM
jgi:integrase